MAAAHFLEEDSELIQNLLRLSKKSPKLVKSSVYPAPADPNIVVRSWKMNEFKYYDIPSPFPTLARGLFSIEAQPEYGRDTTPEKEEERKYRIVARGYDKFFNIGEVPWTTWESLKAHTRAPYTLTLKSNGCIIFIAALTSKKILVTSKHSIGPVAGSALSHAQAGERWLRKYLAEKGRTEEELASVLWENNWTAVSELCDDSFEEHVLPYPPEKTGLHLHGINISTKEFKTLPQTQVDTFAEEWGFIKTSSISVQSVDEVKEFTDEIARSGKWNGEAVEGFVVRTHVTEPPTGKGKSIASSPYAPGSSFFFKVKFDEPYMMYRDWREVTKTLLTGKNGLSESSLPKSKMKRPETRVYVRWVIQEIKRNPKAFQDYTKGKGIIATRERFLKWLQSDQGSTDLRDASRAGVESVTMQNEEKQFGKTIILPVAIPGCGKTAVSVALAHIFGFGHTQSDDVRAKKPGPVFIKNVLSLLKNHDVVIADKNNHLRQHREALRTATAMYDPPVRLLALNWSISDKPQATVHRVCGDRVVQRGENHQTLRADASPAKSHEEVIWMFINTTEELSKNEVDAVVEMELEDDLPSAVRHAVDGCVRVLGLAPPSEEKIEEALAAIDSYSPSIRTMIDDKKKKSAPRFYGFLAELNVEEMLDDLFTDISDDTQDDFADALAFWKTLKNNNRVAKRPHITLVHQKSLPDQQELWNQCSELQNLSTLPLFKASLGNLVWNSRVMAMTVEDVEVESIGDDINGAIVQKFLKKVKEDLGGRLHITVGTKDASIPPVEGLTLVKAWRREDGITVGKISAIPLNQRTVRGRVKGLMG